ncbi:hypothetical protein PCE1_002683 [Barthelona sp. PCE]
MPRVRKFEDDLVMQAYPEGQMIFEGQGLILLKSRENISLIESAIEGKDFVGYVENTREPLKYTYKLRAGESYMIIDLISDDSGILTHLDILLFDHIMSDEHTSRRIPFPFEMNSLRYLSRIFPMDENHLMFTIGDVVNNRRVCLGEYSFQSIIDSPYFTNNYIWLKKCQDDTLWHYNFSVDDMDEAHEPDIEQLHGVHLEHFRCLNSDCIFSVRFRDKEIDELIIFDCQRNQVNLTERFPQLKGLNMYRYSNFTLLTLTQDVLSMVFIGSGIKVIHIENGELKMSEGEMNFKNVLCDDLKHIDLNDNYFRDEDCVFYGVDEITGRYGPIKFREASKEVVHLKTIHPRGIFFDGIAEVYDTNASIRCDFFFKERKLIVLRGCRKPFSHMRYVIESVQSNEAGDFFVMAKKHSETKTYVKIHWHGSESKPITTILPHCGFTYLGFIQGLPVNVDRLAGLVYLGNELILELPPIHVQSVHDSHFDNSACILCDEAIHFFQLSVNGYDVEVQKHIVFEYRSVVDVYFNPRPLAETPDHQLFVVHRRSEESQTQHLHCLDWSTGSFLEPVLIWKKSYDREGEKDYYYQESEYDSDNYYIVEGHSIRNFVGDSYIHVVGGIIKVYIEDGAIKTRFFRNDNLLYYPYTNMKQNHNPNLPNNTVQGMYYKEETKTMMLKTYNIEEDPESINPTVETFHLPSFLAEASIVEYHMPDYHEHV